nr:hypothetical protein [Tanacetum cinerariifolium]
ISPSINSYCRDLMRSFLASFLSLGRVPSFKYSTIGVIQFGSSSSTTVATSFSFMDLSLSTSTSTCLDKCVKLVDAIFLRASAFLFLFRGTWLIEKLVNPLTKLLTLSSDQCFVLSFIVRSCKLKSQRVLNSGKDFFADLERNLFRLANFPLRLWTSLIVRGDGSCSTSAVLSGHGFIPSGMTASQEHSFCQPKRTPFGVELHVDFS